jgi:hypothetical protein
LALAPRQHQDDFPTPETRLPSTAQALTHACYPAQSLTHNNLFDFRQVTPLPALTAPADITSATLCTLFSKVI